MNSALPYSDHRMRLVDQELYNQDLKVIGETPAQLQGPSYREAPHADHLWLFSEGMIHAVKNGKVSYRYQWVKTEQFKAQEKSGERLISTVSPAPDSGLNTHFANTNARRNIRPTASHSCHQLFLSSL